MKIIIYLPGLGYDFFEISGFNYAERYMSSLDKMNPKKEVKYLLEKKELMYGYMSNIPSQVTSIFEYENDLQDKKETHRIYEFYYADSLTEKFKNRNIIVKLIMMLFTLLSKSFTFLKTFALSQNLNFKKRLESLYFFTILGIIAIYAIILFPAILASFTSLLGKIANLDLEDSLVFWYNLSYLISTLTAIVTTTSPDFRKFISNTATEFLCLDYYITLSDNKLEIIGKLESLVEKIAEDEDYDNIELHGYSFGSIILMDSIFPYGNAPALRLTKEVDKIVTIGCPHDFICTFYPDYFKDREYITESSLKKWLNIYSDIDILSSNFRADDKKEDGKFKLTNSNFQVKNIFFNIINPDSLNFWSHLGIIGIRAHKLFWGKGVDSSSCLNMVVNEK